MAVIGERDAVLGFGAVGLAVYPVETPSEAARAVRACAAEGISVVFITEVFAEQISDTIARYKTMPFPAIVPIPGSHPTGYGMRRLRENAEKAIGADILFSKEA